MTWRVLFLSIFFYVQPKSVYGAPPAEVTIGGIFSSSVYDKLPIAAFKIAVDYINNESTILPSTTLKYIINETGSLSPLANAQKACYQISQGVTAIIGPGYSTDAKAVSTITSGLNVPIYSPVATNPTFATDHINYPYLLRMIPPDLISTEVIADLFKTFLWTRLSILTSNSDYAIGAKKQFMSIAERNGWSVVTTQTFPAISDPANLDVRDKLQTIKEIGVRVVFITASDMYTPCIMKLAQELDMINGWGWILLTGGYNTTTTDENIGLVGIRPVIDKGSLYSVFTAKLNAAGYNQNETSYGVPKWFDSVIAFAHGLHNFLQDGNTLSSEKPSCGSCRGDSNSKTNGQLLMKYLKGVQTGGAGHFLNFSNDGSPGVAQYEIVNLQKDGWKMIGEWSNGWGLSLDGISNRLVMWPGSTTDIPIVTKYNLGNRTLNIVTTYETDFIQLKKGKTASDPDPFEGFCIDLINILAKELQFKYTLEFQEDSKYGSYDVRQGKWIGLVGDLVDKKYDLALAPITISQSRSDVVDYSKPYIDLGFTILMKLPEAPNTNMFGFIDPFSGEVWLSAFCAMILVASLSLFFDKISPNGHYGSIAQYSLEGDCEEDEVQQELDGLTYLNLTNSMWFSIGALLQQGGDVLPRSISGRTLAAFWWAASMIIIATYTANLAAFLTYNRMKPRITSVEQLGTQTTVKYGTVAGSPVEEFFKQSILPSYNAMYQYMESRGTLVVNMDAGIERAREENYAFIFDSLFLKRQTYTKPCDLYTAGKVFGQFGYGLAFQKNSPLSDRFSMEITNLRESGVIAGLENYWFKKRGDCSPDLSILKPSTGQLKFDDMIGVLYCVYMGIVLGLTLIVVEWCVASFWEVDPTNPEKPSSWGQAMKMRLRRIWRDLCNHFPEKLKCCKRKSENSSKVNVIKADDKNAHGKPVANNGYNKDSTDVHPFEIEVTCL